MELQVMILDDEHIILDGLCSFPWSDYGYQVAATAKNGLEGLEKLEHIKPDLIFTDVRMPGMDGLDFAERAHEMYPDTVIVILTGYDSFSYAQKAITIGVKEYLLKPIDFEKLNGGKIDPSVAEFFNPVVMIPIERYYVSQLAEKTGHSMDERRYMWKVEY